MRRLLPLILVLMVALPAAAQFSFLGLRNSLVDFVLDQISVPGELVLAAEGVEDAADGSTEIVGLTAADADGVWLRIDRLSLRWTPSRVLRGELAIERLAAIGVDVRRAPNASAVAVEVKEGSELDQQDSDPFDWPRSPITTRIAALELVRVTVAPGVIAPTGIAFDGAGAARDEGDEQSLRFTLTRRDNVFGRIALDFVRDFGADRLDLTLLAEEEPGGLVAALAGLPNDASTRVDLAALGPLTDWDVTLDAAIEGVLAAQGSGRFAAIGPLAANADFAVTPGPRLPEVFGPEIAVALAPEARLRFDLSEDDAGLITIRQGEVRATDLSLDATGTFDRSTTVSNLAVALEARAGLSELVEGVSFDRFGFDGAVTGPTDDLTATGRLALAGLRTAPADVANAALDATVRVTGPNVAADLSGFVEGLRLDRLGPDLLGRTEIALDADWDGATATLAEFRIAAAPLTLEAAGAANVAEERADLTYRLATPDLAPLAAAYEVDAGGTLSAEGRLTGPFALPRLEGSLAAEGLRFEGEGYGEVRLTHDATFGETPEGTAALRASGSRFGPVAFDGGFRLDGQTLALSDMVAEGLGARIAGALALDLETTLAEGAFDIAAPDLAPLSAFTGNPASGALQGSVTLSRRDGMQDATAALRLDRLEAGLPDGARALAARAEVDLAVRDALGAPEAEGRVSAEGVEALGYGVARLIVEGRGAALAGGNPEFDVTGDFAGALLGPARAASGRFSAAGALSAFNAALSVEGVEGDETVGEAAVASVSLEARVLDAAGDPAVEGLALTASGLSGYGLALGGLEAEGSASALLSAPAFDLTARIARADLGGATVAATTVTAKGGLDDIAATLRAEGLAAGEARIASAALDATVREASGGDPALDARLRLGAADLGPATLASTTLSARGRLSALALDLAAEGELSSGEPLALAAAARADLAGAGPQATVSRFSLDAGEAALALRAPLRIVSANGSTRFEGIDLSLPGGGLTGAAALHPNGLSGDIRLAAPDLPTLAALAGAPVSAGALDLSARFDTRPGTAGATARIAAPGLRFEDALADVGALDLEAALDWDGREARLDASLTGPFDQPFRVRAATPLRPTGGPLPAPPAGGRLSGAVDWQGRIGELWSLVPAPGHVLDGAARIALVLSGTLDAPEIGGDIALTDGRYENLDTGTILVDLEIASTVEPGGAFVLDLRAEDGSGGPVTGRVALADGRLDARVKAEGATLVRRDDVTAILSLDIAAAGPFAAPDISGRVNIDRAEVRLVAATPPGIADLGSVRIKGEPIPEPPEPFGEEIDLNIDVTGPQDIFVRGRGLDSEWTVALQIRGTAAAPRIRGAVERRRGVLSFLGRVFELERGAVRFTGAPGIDPTLDVALFHENDGVRGGIVVAGTAQAPDISFQSRPALPEEEVLPRVLFGRSKQSLSPTEALSLAVGLATLLDGTGGSADSVRGAVGLDVLRLDDDGSGNSSVTVGSNVSRDVFVGAKQPISGGSGSVIVEIEIFDELQLESEVGPDVGTTLGLKWKRDF
ncbi:MAG: translocation/assembly module TamB domain-containing protein [Pikeienuella sp.]|uniref:translocation/assembly module TamB domain-containing protein n=1 Tax=Pikeienuella sp. TaxID=2831957 RepID=UPI00391D7056